MHFHLRKGGIVELARIPEDELVLIPHRGSPADVLQLAAKGYDLDSRDRDGRTLIINCAAVGNYDLIKVLGASGADVNLTDHRGFSALHVAAINHYPEVIRTLVAAGAVVDLLDQYGNSPLFRAVFYRSDRRIETIQALLDSGADRDLANSSGVSPYSLAQSSPDLTVDWPSRGHG